MLGVMPDAPHPTSSPTSAPPILTWEFPLPRTHCGVLIGNGVQGLMVWGDARLCITVSRAGFWDHRGGNLFASRTTYAEVRRLLESHDEAGIRKVFARDERRDGIPEHPQQLGGGRIELVVGKGFRPSRAELATATGTLRVTFENQAGATAGVTIRQAMDAEMAWLDCDDAELGGVAVEIFPTWHHVSRQLEKVGVSPPRHFDSPRGGGFIQELPEDQPLALAWEKHGHRIVVATALGTDTEQRAVALARAAEVGVFAGRADEWWADYWHDVPRVRVPDAGIQHLWDYGVYKQAGMTTPGGVAATLQGPWMEEYQLPPWSNDYHFNINVQMVYWPCLGTNRLAHLEPLWEMIAGWMPRLRENAEHFFGAKDALMLPHAVDDRCAAVGSYWTGMIDHGCTAWMALLAWSHYRHGLELRVARDIAWPLLVGAFNGYWAMLEELETDGKRRLSLPVSVSPEYRGDNIDAWGRDASFQLAALHAVARALPRAAALLGYPEDPRWGRVRAELPPYTLVGGKGDWHHRTAIRRIGLWEGTDLEESHRHHSHLAAIYPFRTIEPSDVPHQEAVRHSIDHWVRTGAGMWSGWCVPWAAIICARLDSGDAAVAWLHWMKDVFTNLGHGTLHNADAPGTSVMLSNRTVLHGLRPVHNEMMQMDATFGAVTAILELLVQCRGDRIVVLPSLPEKWATLDFDGVLVEGAFTIGATARRRRLVEIRVVCTKGGALVIEHGLGEHFLLDGVPCSGEILHLDTRPGQALTLRHDPATDEPRVAAHPQRRPHSA